MRYVALSVCALAPLLLVVAGCDRDGPDAGSDETEAERVTGEPTEVVLFFAGSDGRLQPEVRRLQLADDTTERARAIVEALLAGPDDEGIYAHFPDDVEVDLSYGGDRILYVDLVHPELDRPPASGSREELLRVYGVVNTLLGNIEEPRGVVLLWNGRQRVSFGGHVDTSRPLRPRRELIAETS